MKLSDTRGVDGSVDGDATRAALDRVLAHETFAQAERLRRLLRFLVDRTLSGHADEIKEYVLGREVFDRGEDYDPRLDSIVRVEVRRLRSKLDEYYLGDGAGDPVRIHIRRGSYVPVFEARPPGADRGDTRPGPTPGPAARWRPRAMLAMLALILAAVLWQLAASPFLTSGSDLPRVAVLPFESYPPTGEMSALADRLADRVTTSLVRGGGVEVVSRRSAVQFPRGARSTREIGAALGAALLLEATLEREPGHGLRLDARLVDPARDRKVWADTYRAPGDALDQLEQQLLVGAAQAIAAHTTSASR